MPSQNRALLRNTFRRPELLDGLASWTMSQARNGPRHVYRACVESSAKRGVYRVCKSVSKVSRSVAFEGDTLYTHVCIFETLFRAFEGENRVKLHTFRTFCAELGAGGPDSRRTHRFPIGSRSPVAAPLACHNTDAVCPVAHYQHTAC